MVIKKCRHEVNFIIGNIFGDPAAAAGRASCVPRLRPDPLMDELTDLEGPYLKCCLWEGGKEGRKKGFAGNCSSDDGATNKLAGRHARTDSIQSRSTSDTVPISFPDHIHVVSGVRLHSAERSSAGAKSDTALPSSVLPPTPSG